MSGWQPDDLLDALDVEAATGEPAAVPLARWLREHPDGPQTAEDYADQPAELPTVHRPADAKPGVP